MKRSPIDAFTLDQQMTMAEIVESVRARLRETRDKWDAAFPDSNLFPDAIETGWTDGKTVYNKIVRPNAEEDGPLEPVEEAAQE